MAERWLKPVRTIPPKSLRSALNFIVVGAAALIVSVFPLTPNAQDIPEKTKAAKTLPPALWVVDGVGKLTISVYNKGGLAKKTGIIIPNGKLATPAQGPASDLTFDSANNVWASLCNGPSQTGYVIEISPADFIDIAKGGSISPTLVIQDPAGIGVTPSYLACPRGLGFDQSGNLWVEAEDTTDPELLEYTPDQLSAGTQVIDPEPSAVITTATLDESVKAENSPPSSTFDQHGNLWVAGGISAANPFDEIVVEYTAAQLASGAQAGPNQTLVVADTSASSALNAPASIAFDAGGNLWVAFAQGGDGDTGGVEMFAVADLAGSGTITPTPSVVLSSGTLKYGKLTLPSFASPDGLAFDSTGDLWVANADRVDSDDPNLGAGSLVEFSAAKLKSSGSPSPLRGILANSAENNIGFPVNISFGPGLP